VRAVARALASRTRVGASDGPLDCRGVWVGRRRCVRIAEPGAGVVSLARDLRARGAARRAEQLLAAYALAADDYEVYRAPALRDGGSRSLLIVTGGGVATGKSTLAKALSRRMAIPLVIADRVRDALLAPLAEPVAHEIAWTPEFVTRIYGDVFARADAVLASGRSVVLDACFPRVAQRREAAALAARHAASFVFVHCDAAPGEIAARLAKRDARDGGGWHALAEAAPWEPLEADEPGRHLRIESRRAPVAWLRALADPTEEPA